MTSNVERIEIKAMVESDLAAICRKLADNSALPDELRATAREMVKEYEAYSATYGKENATEQFEGETLMIKMARFLPQLAEVAVVALES